MKELRNLIPTRTGKAAVARTIRTPCSTFEMGECCMPFVTISAFPPVAMKGTFIRFIVIQEFPSLLSGEIAGLLGRGL
jgi:hypothetical protein